MLALKIEGRFALLYYKLLVMEQSKPPLPAPPTASVLHTHLLSCVGQHVCGGVTLSDSVLEVACDGKKENVSATLPLPPG